MLNRAINPWHVMVAVLVLAALGASSVAAQRGENRSVVASGGGTAGNGTTRAHITIGQSVSGSIQTVHQGFWFTTSPFVPAVSSAEGPLRSVTDQVSIAPSPATASTAITYSLKKAAAVTLRIVDMQGRTTSVVDLGFRPSGASTTVVDVTDLPAGAYMVGITDGSEMRMGRLVVAR